MRGGCHSPASLPSSKEQTNILPAIIGACAVSACMCMVGTYPNGSGIVAKVSSPFQFPQYKIPCNLLNEGITIIPVRST